MGKTEIWSGRQRCYYVYSVIFILLIDSGRVHALRLVALVSVIRQILYLPRFQFLCILLQR